MRSWVLVSSTRMTAKVARWLRREIKKGKRMELWVELIGYIGSFLVALSLFMGNILKLRWINLAGALSFIVYGSIIHAYPIVVLNAVLAFANSYHLWRLNHERVVFEIVKVNSEEDLVTLFLKQYLSVIQKEYPHFNAEQLADADSFMVLKKLQPIGLYVYHKERGEEGQLIIDYMTPAFHNIQYIARLYRRHVRAMLDHQVHLLTIPIDHITQKKRYRKLGFTENKTKQRLEYRF